MEKIQTFYGRIEKNMLYFDTNEVANRLGTSRQYTHSAIEKCKALLLDAADCRYCGIKTYIEADEQCVRIGDIVVNSKALAKNIGLATECFVFAVTLGSAVDRLLKKLEITSVSDHYITDALASALAESVADIAEDLIKDKVQCRPRFSPGYADFSIEYQFEILEMVDARKYLGISLSDTYLMTPQKSITAVMGIKKNTEDY